MHVDLNVLPLAHRRHPRFANECYKSVNIVGYSLSDFFVPIAHRGGRMTRESEQNNMIAPPPMNNSGRKALAVRGPTTWNRIPNCFRQIDSFKGFKHDYAAHMTANFR